MFEDVLPKRKIGCLFPLSVIDYHPYEFYQLVPKDMMLVTVSLGLEAFTREDVERVFASVDEKLAVLLDHGIDLVIQTGVPLPILVGTDFLDRLLAHIEEKAGVPATSTVLNVVAATKHLGIERIAVANKWNDQMNATLGQFFAREGVAVVGANARSMVPSEFTKMDTLESLELAYELGRGALETFSDAEALYIGGGSWLSLPVVERLEKEFGKPVMTNLTATVWHVSHLLDCWNPMPGYGRLLESDS
jgi:maleate cis-trans isomerase